HSYLAQRPSPANRDEVKEYLEEPIYEDEAVEDPFEWWRQREKDFPRLARMAYDLLSIPSTACECERVFSLAKLLVGTQRHSLQDLTMEMLTSALSVDASLQLSSRIGMDILRMGIESIDSFDAKSYEYRIERRAGFDRKSIPLGRTSAPVC
ncbi:Uncharacterized protein HZ326_31680, partial [Fusarium oxysporum f. sp. albedinis]